MININNLNVSVDNTKILKLIDAITYSLLKNTDIISSECATNIYDGINAIHDIHFVV